MKHFQFRIMTVKLVVFVLDSIKIDVLHMTRT